MPQGSALPYDVVVVGGGPSGSQVAYRLAGKRRSVAVVEQKANYEQTVCCTGIVSESCLREFEIDEALVFRHSKSATLYSPSGKPVRLERKTNQAAILDRSAFNAFMAKRAMQSGAEYLLETKAQEIDAERDVAVIEGVSKGRTIRIEAKTIVLATGSSGYLSQRLGLGKPGNVAAGIQAEVATNGAAEVEVYFGRKIAPGFFAWLVPTSDGRALAGLLAHRRPAQQLTAFLDFLVSRGRIQGTPFETTSAPLPLKALRKCYGNRVLIVGTAAGMVKPTTGGGIYYGLLSADIAAGVLDQALATGDLSGQTLAQYRKLVMGKLAHELSAGAWGRTIFEHLTDSQQDRAFEILRRPGTIQMLMDADDVSFDWHSEAIAHLLRQRTLAKLTNGTAFPLPGKHPARERPFTKGDSK